MLSTVRRDLVGQGMRRDLSAIDLCSSSVFCDSLSLHFTILGMRVTPLPHFQIMEWQQPRTKLSR